MSDVKAWRDAAAKAFDKMGDAADDERERMETERASKAWRDAASAPELESVLTCQAGRAKSVRLMYKGDGSPKHPACWICEISREPISEFEVPDFWVPLEALPAIPLKIANVEGPDNG